MMMKVTGPMKLHMKWLSTLSQHLGHTDTIQNQTKPNSSTWFSQSLFFFACKQKEINFGADKAGQSAVNL